MTKNKQRCWCFFLTLILVMGGLLFAQNSFYHYLKSQSIRFFDADYSSISLMRLQALDGASGSTMMMGSSQTERFLQRKDLVVMGVPGSPFSTAWEYFYPLGQYEKGSLIILEGNLLINEKNESLIDLVTEPLFKMKSGSANFSMAAKPSAMFLSYCVNRFMGVALAQYEEQCLGVLPMSPENLDGLQEDDIWHQIREVGLFLTREAMMDCVNRRVRTIEQMEAQSHHPVLVFYPTNYQLEGDLKTEQARLALTRFIAKTAEIPLLNYLEVPQKSELQFTDTHHLKSMHAGTSKLRNTIIRDAKLSLDF